MQIKEAAPISVARVFRDICMVVCRVFASENQLRNRSKSGARLRYFQAPILEQNRQNVLGVQIRRIRTQQNISQEMLAARCSVAGWDISRGTLAKIEAGIRCITDREAAVLALALRVSLYALYPIDLAARLRKLGEA